MPPPPKGKAPTKGSKQILEENVATVSFYRNMALGAGALNAVATVYFNNFTTLVILLNILAVTIYVGSCQILKYMSRAQIDPAGNIIHPGLDLNMEGGMGEHIKDIVILTSITHMLAIVSNYFWLLLLFLPMRAFWLVWVNILGPWFFQPAPEDGEQEDKKRKKMEKKMKRIGGRQ